MTEHGWPNEDDWRAAALFDLGQYVEQACERGLTRSQILDAVEMELDNLVGVLDGIYERHASGTWTVRYEKDVPEPALAPPKPW